MSKLVLTDVHKAMLVEMTKSVMYEYEITVDTDNNLCYYHKELPNKDGKIAWLEHVVFHLAKKILRRDDNLLMLFRNSCLAELSKVDAWSHPVIFLYDRYKLSLIKKEAAIKNRETIIN